MSIFYQPMTRGWVTDTITNVTLFQSNNMTLKLNDIIFRSLLLHFVYICFSLSYW